MSVPDTVPRPPAPEPPPFVQWLQRVRADPRVAVAIVLTIALAAGVALWRAGRPASPAVPAAEAEDVAAAVTTATTTAGSAVLVHVVGAVRVPGVVQLQTGSRVLDAVDAAGGAADDADIQRLNLAARVTDGQRVAVPRIGEPDPPPALGEPVGGAGATGASGPIDVNTATAAELETLPGVGPAIAEAIIRERERSGGFRTVDDLQRVRGIGEARLEALRDLVVAG